MRLAEGFLVMGSSVVDRSRRLEGSNGENPPRAAPGDIQVT